MSPDGGTIYVGGLDYRLQPPTSELAAYAASTGTELWAQRQHQDAWLVILDMAVSPDGSMLYVTGIASRATYDFETVAYRASTGEPLWVRTYDGTGHGSDVPSGLAVSPDGSTVFVTGNSWSGAAYLDDVTIAYDAASGAGLWIRRYEGPGHHTDSPVAVAVSPDGSDVFVTGFSDTTFEYSSNYTTIAYRAQSGRQLWVAEYDGPAALADRPWGMVVTPDSSTLVVTGESPGADGLDFATVAYATGTGAQRWVARYDGPSAGADQGLDIDVAPDGSSVYVSGESDGASGHVDIATVAYATSDGTQRWVTRYTGPGIGEDEPADIAVSPDGTTVFVTGSSPAAGTTYLDDVTIAYRAAGGSQSWVRRYAPRTTGFGRESVLMVAPDGATLYVSMGVLAGSGFDVVTIAADIA
jgi:outer membrane protein assembly factor BamB